MRSHKIFRFYEVMSTPGSMFCLIELLKPVKMLNSKVYKIFLKGRHIWVIGVDVYRFLKWNLTRRVG
jgi:hypothetical protein